MYYTILSSLKYYKSNLSESLAQLIETGKKVVDNPTHLADFGAALTSGESHQLQAVLESTNVC